jgi:proton-coupled amino acid transporter
MLFPVVEIIERRIGIQGSVMKGNILRAGLVLITIVTVCIITDFSTIMVLIGATCCSLLAFILPAITHLRIFRNRLTKQNKIEDYTILVFGIIGAIIGSIDAAKRLGIIPIPEGEEVTELP